MGTKLSWKAREGKGIVHGPWSIVHRLKGERQGARGKVVVSCWFLVVSQKSVTTTEGYVPEEVLRPEGLREN